MARKCTKPAHSAARPSAKRGALAKNTIGLTGARAAKWYGSNWIRKEKRHALYARDGYACVYCGSKHNLTLDHVVAAEHGGTNDASNLVTACRSCNSRKGASCLRTFARLVASESGVTTRSITNRVRKQLRARFDVALARALLADKREAREERDAIADADSRSDSTLTDDATSFDFA